MPSARFLSGPWHLRRPEFFFVTIFTVMLKDNVITASPFELSACKKNEIPSVRAPICNLTTFATSRAFPSNPGVPVLERRKKMLDIANCM